MGDEMRSCTVVDWKKVIWSEESTFFQFQSLDGDAYGENQRGKLYRINREACKRNVKCVPQKVYRNSILLLTVNE